MSKSRFLLIPALLLCSMSAQAWSPEYDYSDTAGFSCRFWTKERLYRIAKPGSTYSVSKSVVSATRRGPLLYEIHGTGTLKEPKSDEKQLDFTCFIQYIQEHPGDRGNTRIASLEFSDPELNKRLWKKERKLEPDVKIYSLPDKSK
ncbi:MAG: hypothetical protein HGA71_08235 [Azonexaceae bacterium]|nr:hypothetical protein [Azonexaceae bacterium]